MNMESVEINLMKKPKREKTPTSPVRVNDIYMQELREAVSFLDVSDSQAVGWACQSFVAQIKDEENPPDVPPIIAALRGAKK